MSARIGRRTVGELKVCPYNPAHVVEDGPRFQRHLIECVKDHKHMEEVICRFNHTHRVKAPDAAHHMMTCPDRFTVERELIEVANKSDMKFREKLPKADETILPASTECWDDELLAEPVSIPSIHNNKAIKFVNSDSLSGLKPAQKKKFRQNLWKGKATWIDEDDPEENGEPMQPISQANKPIRLPSREPRAAQIDPMLEKLHIGRGMRRPNAPPPPSLRIAANIFGKPMVQEQLPQYGLAGIGRGMPLTMSKAASLSLLPGEAIPPTTARGVAPPPQSCMPSMMPPPPRGSVPAMMPPAPSSLPSPAMLAMMPATTSSCTPAQESTNSPTVDNTQPQLSSATPPLNGHSNDSSRDPSATRHSESPGPPLTQVDSATDEPIDPKWRKRLEKKLKQILRLEERLAAGETLDNDELGKINLKDAVLEELGLKKEDE